MSSLASARRKVTAALAPLELPTCFQLATVNAALNAQERKTVSAKAARRRLLAKAERIAGIA